MTTFRMLEPSLPFYVCLFGAMQTDPGHVVSELQRLSVGMPRERGPLPGGLTIETPEEAVKILRDEATVLLAKNAE